ncbi:sigma-54-dependent Fis family transcriptional regulator [Kurthia huakuii]|uniref:sigma-54-dependent Fis family transcriptional regulator n=1 Tax=Kurthia huakuii TaxID=1421019 RepID=UPI000498225D|nr:sigma-54-dependent Fis family transcriptional regulator [Kurthia huakuii]MBM7698215.1 transcriptional regulator with PAS, ATPase and Fis domain [Kurthia huakuii]
MLIREFMVEDFPCLTETTTLQQAIHYFLEAPANMLPVVSEHRELVGIMTRNRLLRAINEGSSLAEPIASFIKRDVVYLEDDATIEEAKEALMSNNVGHAPILNAAYQPVGLLSTAQIFTAYDHLYERLENQWQLVIEHLPFALATFDLHKTILSQNGNAKKLYKQLSEAERQAIFAITDDMLEEELAPIRQKLTLPSRTLLVQCFPLKRKKQHVGMVIIVEDWTNLETLTNELKLSREWQAKLQSTMSLAYDALILTNEQGQITMVNNGCCELFHTEQQQLLQQPIRALLPDLDFAGVFDKGLHYVNTPATIQGMQCLVTLMPLESQHETLGIICKITYRGLKQLQGALKRVTELEKQVTKYESEIQSIKGTKYSFASIAGTSQAITRAITEATAAAKSRSTVLLRGESGTGKELFAHGIHVASAQTGHFVEVNCAAIPKELMESEFFGYEDGAFTGAKRGGQKGKFEIAQNGTLFLDEIGDMSLDLQAKLLRVLQEKEFSPVGSAKKIIVQTKIIAATNRDLERMIVDGTFRQDLYYRLNIMQIHIPPLRERLDDVPAIVEAILKSLTAEGFYIQGIMQNALSSLMQYTWPGNVRELHNVLERAANLAIDGWITRDTLPALGEMPRAISEKPAAVESMATILADKERQLIVEALARNGGNKSKTCKELGYSRTWLYNKMQEYQL